MNLMTKIYEYHLSTWFILPVTGLCKKDFEPFGFLNTYISEDCKYVYVTTQQRPMLNYPVNAKLVVTQDPIYISILTIADVYHEDVLKYRDGRFSELSDKIKGRILERSSLSYEIGFDQNIPVITQMDLRLAPLWTNHRHAMEDVLAEIFYEERDREEGLAILQAQSELLSKPKSSEFVTLHYQ